MSAHTPRSHTVAGSHTARRSLGATEQRQFLRHTGKSLLQSRTRVQDTDESIRLHARMQKHTACVLLHVFT
jgi:hypothetical protein